MQQCVAVALKVLLRQFADIALTREVLPMKDYDNVFLASVSTLGLSNEQLPVEASHHSLGGVRETTMDWTSFWSEVEHLVKNKQYVSILVALHSAVNPHAAQPRYSPSNSAAERPNLTGPSAPAGCHSVRQLLVDSVDAYMNAWCATLYPGGSGSVSSSDADRSESQSDSTSDAVRVRMQPIRSTLCSHASLVSAEKVWTWSANRNSRAKQLHARDRDLALFYTHVIFMAVDYMVAPVSQWRARILSVFDDEATQKGVLLNLMSLFSMYDAEVTHVIGAKHHVSAADEEMWYEVATCAYVCLLANLRPFQRVAHQLGKVLSHALLARPLQHRSDRLHRIATRMLFLRVCSLDPHLSTGRFLLQPYSSVMLSLHGFDTHEQLLPPNLHGLAREAFDTFRALAVSKVLWNLKDIIDHTGVPIVAVDLGNRHITSDSTGAVARPTLHPFAPGGGNPSATDLDDQMIKVARRLEDALPTMLSKVCDTLGCDLVLSPHTLPCLRYLRGSSTAMHTDFREIANFAKPVEGTCQRCLRPIPSHVPVPTDKPYLCRLCRAGDSQHMPPGITVNVCLQPPVPPSSADDAAEHAWSSHGPLEFVAGSHHVGTGESTSCATFAHVPLVRPRCDVGDALVFNDTTWHQGSRDTKHDGRLALEMRLVPSECVVAPLRDPLQVVAVYGYRHGKMVVQFAGSYTPQDVPFRELHGMDRAWLDIAKRAKEPRVAKHRKPGVSSRQSGHRSSGAEVPVYVPLRGGTLAEDDISRDAATSSTRTPTPRSSQTLRCLVESIAWCVPRGALPPRSVTDVWQATTADSLQAALERCRARVRLGTRRLHALQELVPGAVALVFVSPCHVVGVRVAHTADTVHQSSTYTFSINNEYRVDVFDTAPSQPLSLTTRYCFVCEVQVLPSPLGRAIYTWLDKRQLIGSVSRRDLERCFSRQDMETCLSAWCTEGNHRAFYRLEDCDRSRATHKFIYEPSAGKARLHIIPMTATNKMRSRGLQLCATPYTDVTSHPRIQSHTDASLDSLCTVDPTPSEGSCLLEVYIQFQNRRRAKKRNRRMNR